MLMFNSWLTCSVPFRGVPLNLNGLSEDHMETQATEALVWGSKFRTWDKSFKDHRKMMIYHWKMVSDPSTKIRLRYFSRQSSALEVGHLSRGNGRVGQITQRQMSAMRSHDPADLRHLETVASKLKQRDFSFDLIDVSGIQAETHFFPFLSPL